MDKDDFEEFDRYLDEAEEWRHIRARKDEEKYGSLSKDYDDRLQRQYLNFKSNKFQSKLMKANNDFQSKSQKSNYYFQIFLAIITILGMLLASYFGYYLAQDRSPQIYVGGINIDSDSMQASVYLTNEKDFSAIGLSGTYEIDGKNMGNIVFDDSTLKDDKTLGFMDLDSIRNIAISKCRESLISQINFITASEGVKRTCDNQHKLRILDISCETCNAGDIIPIETEKEITSTVDCFHGNKSDEFNNCELRNLF